MKHRSILLTLILGSCLVAASAQQPLALTGKIVDGSTGRPVVGATVLAIREPPDPVKGGPDFQTAITVEDGSYAIPELLAGSYRVCVQSDTYFDPCRGRPEAYVRAEVSSKSSAMNLSLERAAIVRIIVQDPGGKLQLKEGKEEGAHLLVGMVDESGLFQTFTLKANSGTSRVYEGRARPGTSARLIVHAEQFSLADADGTPIESSSVSVPLNVPTDGTADERAIRIR